MGYYQRIALVSLALALFTALLIWRGPQVRDVALVARAPNGEAVSAGAAISFTFSRAVDRRSAEQSLRITPMTPGRFFWEDRTLTFRPNPSLEPATTYGVTLTEGLRDAQGRANRAAISWSFRTRSPQLLLIGGGAGEPGALWLAGSDGSAPRQIYAAPEGIGGVAPAPDGQRALVVEARGRERNALVLLDLADGFARPLVDAPDASASAPAWSPNGDFIAFERRSVLPTGLGQPRVWLAQPDGTALGPLAGGNDEISYAPVWSPDGNRVALIDGVAQTVGIYDFFSDSRRTLPDGSGEPVSWSPDNTALVYGSATPAADGLRLRIRRADLGRDAVQDLTDGSAADYSPAWSPDGVWIAFVRRTATEPGSSIWVMRADGSELRRLTSPGPHLDTLPAWSPDSRQLAFVRNSASGALTGVAWTVDLASGETRPILDNVTQAVWTP